MTEARGDDCVTCGRWGRTVALLIALCLCYGAAAIGGLSGGGAGGGWYADLVKPPWTPPSWVFGPVWTVLYGMMAVAAWLVWIRRHHQPVAVPLTAFALQLVLNATWSPLFFGLHRVDLASADLVLLWGVLVVTVWLFLRRCAIAGLLLMPYLLWVTFAAALNFAIWRLNR
jgi:tryptophan-rich sensory protein